MAISTIPAIFDSPICSFSSRIEMIEEIIRLSPTEVGTMIDISVRCSRNSSNENDAPRQHTAAAKRSKAAP